MDTSQPRRKTDAAEPRPLALGRVFSEAWHVLDGSKSTLWLALFLYLGITLTLGLVQEAFGAGTEASATFVDILFLLANAGISGAIGGGLIVLAARLSLREPVKPTDVLAYLPRFFSAMLTWLLMSLLLVLGFLLLIIPGLYLTVGYSFALPLALEKELSPWQALETSRKTVHRHWWTVATLLGLGQLLLLAGIMTLGIGLIWFLPLAMLVYGIGYHDLFGVSGRETGQGGGQGT